MTYRESDERQLLTEFLAWLNARPAHLPTDKLVAEFLAQRQDERAWGKKG